MQRPTGGHVAPTQRPARPARSAVGDDLQAPMPERVLPPAPWRLAPRLDELPWYGKRGPRAVNALSCRAAGRLGQATLAGPVRTACMHFQPREARHPVYGCGGAGAALLLFQIDQTRWLFRFLGLFIGSVCDCSLALQPSSFPVVPRSMTSRQEQSFRGIILCIGNLMQHVVRPLA